LITDTKTTNRGKHLGKSVRRKFRKYQRIVSYVTPYWQFKAVIFLIVVGTMMDVISPALIGNTIDIIKLIENGETFDNWNGGIAGSPLLYFAKWVFTSLGYDLKYTALGVFVSTIVVLAALVAIINYVIRYGTAYYSQKGSYELRKDLYNHLLDQSFSFYDKQRTGQLMAKATGDIDQVQRFYDLGLRQIVSTILLGIGVIVTLLSMNLILCLLTLVTLPFIIYTMLMFGQKSFPVTQSMRQQYGEITSIFQENLMGLRVVRGFAQEDQEKQKIRNELDQYFDSQLLTAKYRAFYLPLATFISGIGFVIIMWYGGNLVIAGALSLGNFVAFYFYLFRIAQPVRILGMILNLFIRANAASDRVFGIVDSHSTVKDSPDSVDLINPTGHVEFQNVSFGYDDNLVLKNISLDVKAGTTVAILGATGSGKSSVISLIPRFYDVTSGSIKIDGRDIREYTIKSLRNNIGIVRQELFIFSTTFKENIAFGVDDTSLGDIEAAAKNAKIHDYIMSTPQGYDTEIGERGVTISGGQKQRIAIARALLRNPKILILDDSTSSVDTETEHEIQQVLDKLLKDRTTFIITQRLSSIKKANYIVVLDRGEIVEEGSHESLMALNGLYRRLYETQVSGAVEEVE
jgi:ABC-type multidrug transport system fused ATPase/permease subunit